jgi:hypothetical protein
MALTTTTQPETGAESRRLDLDAMDARIAEIEAQERAQTPALSLTPETPEQKLARLTEENERLRRMIAHSIEARNSAVEFVNLWADPRRLPDLVQEVFQSHPDIPKIREKLNEETARRVARLIAHLAVTYQVHPLISGMIYAWPDEGVARVELGYRAYLEMLKRHSLDFDGPFEMDDAQRALHGLSGEDRGALYYVYDWPRMERFARYGRECKPFTGEGVWRKNQTVPKGRSGQWVAEKNALKDAARRALSFAIMALANAEVLDVAYDQELDMWSVPAPTALWTHDPAVVKAFEALLTEHHITDEEWNQQLGHNWRYTPIEREEMRTRVLTYVEGRPAVVNGEVILSPIPDELPTSDSAAEPAPAEPDSLAHEAADAPALEPPSAPEPAATGQQPDGESTPVEEKAPEPSPEAVQAPLSVPCSFEGCHEPGTDTPEGWLCSTHARKAADSRAAKSEKARK